MKKTGKLLLPIITVILILSGCGNDADIKNQFPGKYDDYTLLPNGWKLTPAGCHIDIGELPLNLIITNDEKYAFTSNSGQGEHSISLISLEDSSEIQRVKLGKTWRGLAFNEDDSKLFVSGGYDDVILIYDFNGKLNFADTLFLKDKEDKNKISVTGIAFDPMRNKLLAVSKESNSLYVCDPGKLSVDKVINMSAECYEVEINGEFTKAYISLWGAGAVAEIDLNSFEETARIKTGDHPCEMVITKDGKHLFVTNANNNTTSLLDLISKKEIEKINSSLKADAPYGSTPNSVTLNEDETMLIIANADNNYLALFDVTEKGDSKSLGFIPTGWYPTGVRYLKNSNQLVVANGKGLTSAANPNGPKPGTKQDYSTMEYIGNLFKGSISLIEFPKHGQLTQFTNAVFANTPYTSKEVNWHGVQNVISENHNGERSAEIRHVFYIIKENRTYDQVFGDIKKGKGDSTLCLFPYDITPNQHELAQQFALFDNFYVNAEVSADGHNWTTAAYASDYIEKNWPTLYGGRGGSYDYEGGADIAKPSSGYIWDKVLDAGLVYRNYGEFVKRVEGSDSLYEGVYDNIKTSTCTGFPGYDLRITDVYRFERWYEDFQNLEEKGEHPDFAILRIPNDHTAGTREGYPTVKAMVADNDYAVGMIVDKISHSKFWKNTIIFVLEDDAQNGSDHIDAHRSPLLVVSPYIKRGIIDSTMYSTSSVLKTIELILGLTPMTQFDLSATPILFPITDEPDFTPYNVVQPIQNIHEMNKPNAYGAVRSAEMNLAVEDAIPDIEFNEIIWKAVKGEHSEMPPPVRSAFVIVQSDEDDD